MFLKVQAIPFFTDSCLRMLILSPLRGGMGGGHEPPPPSFPCDPGAGSPVFGTFAATTTMECAFNTLSVVVCDRLVEALEVWGRREGVCGEGFAAREKVRLHGRGVP